MEEELPAYVLGTATVVVAVFAALASAFSTLATKKTTWLVVLVSPVAPAVAAAVALRTTLAESGSWPFGLFVIVVAPVALLGAGAMLALAYVTARPLPRAVSFLLCVAAVAIGGLSLAASSMRAQTCRGGQLEHLVGLGVDIASDTHGGAGPIELRATAGGKATALENVPGVNDGGYARGQRFMAVCEDAGVLVVGSIALSPDLVVGSARAARFVSVLGPPRAWAWLALLGGVFASLFLWPRRRSADGRESVDVRLATASCLALACAAPAAAAWIASIA